MLGAAEAAPRPGPTPATEIVMKPCLARLLLAASLCGASIASHAWTHYTVRLLAPGGSDAAFFESFADDLNSLGHALVRVVVSGSGTGYYVCRDDGCTLVGNSLNMQIHGLDDLDRLAGQIYEGHDYAFVGDLRIGYGRGACVSCGIGLESDAFASNHAGEATGWAQFGVAGTQAFKYTKATGLVSLGTLGGTSSQGRRINKHGNVVGQSMLPGDADSHGFLYARGLMTDLGTLGGRQSTAQDLNSHDTVVGCSLLADNLTQRAFRYESGVLSALPSLTARSSCANAINNHGVAVGTSQSAGGPKAVVFHKDGRVKNLNALVEPISGQHWTLEEATGINEAGQIVGNGRYRSVRRAFLLTPIAP